jgi:hypothetical protein
VSMARLEPLILGLRVDCSTTAPTCHKQWVLYTWPSLKIS